MTNETASAERGEPQGHKSMTETPLPWTFEAGVEDSEGEFYVCHAGTVCTATTVCNPCNEADARFIVHAVNSHHDLVEALRAVRAMLSPYDGAQSRVGDAFKIVDATLTKAEAGR